MKRNIEQICKVCYGNLLEETGKSDGGVNYKCDSCGCETHVRRMTLRDYLLLPLVMIFIMPINVVIQLFQPCRFCSFCHKNITWKWFCCELGKNGEQFYCEECFSKIPHPRNNNQIL